MKALLRIAIFVSVSVLFLVNSERASGGSATWSSNPLTGDWDLLTNWSPPAVPNGPADVATFDSSATSSVFLTANTEVAAINFDSGAPAYTITAVAPFTLTISGSGVANNSGATQNFVSGGVLGDISFFGNASAGGSAVYTTNSGGLTHFYDTATAGSATLISNAGGETDFLVSSTAGSATLMGNGGEINFFGSSNAGNATIELNGGSLGFTETASAGSAAITLNNAASARFQASTTASTATITINGGSILTLEGSAPASQSTLIVNDGFVSIVGNSSSGGTANLQLGSAGVVRAKVKVTGTVGFGSLSGSGQIQIGPNTLQVGANNLSTTFSGSITGTPQAGSLNKVGSGTLTLTGQSTFNAGTSVQGGVLLLNNKRGSATGAWLVSVVGATSILGGNGAATGGAIFDLGGTLVPSLGTGKPTPLKLGQSLTFEPNSAYHVIIDSQRGTADKVTATNITIFGAQLTLTDISNSRLPLGTAFVVINNTSALPISGQFGDLSDGGTIVAGKNTFQASYEGGDGNDLTLTVTN